MFSNEAKIRSSLISSASLLIHETQAAARNFGRKVELTAWVETLIDQAVVAVRRIALRPFEADELSKTVEGDGC